MNNPINSIDPDGRYTLTGQAAQDAFRDLQNGSSFNSIYHSYDKTGGIGLSTDNVSIGKGNFSGTSGEAEEGCIPCLSLAPWVAEALGLTAIGVVSTVAIIDITMQATEGGYLSHYSIPEEIVGIPGTTSWDLSGDNNKSGEPHIVYEIRGYNLLSEEVEVMKFGTALVRRGSTRMQESFSDVSKRYLKSHVIYPPKVVARTQTKPTAIMVESYLHGWYFAKTGQWPRATASRYKGDAIKTFEKVQNFLNK